MSGPIKRPSQPKVQFALRPPSTKVGEKKLPPGQKPLNSRQISKSKAKHPKLKQGVQKDRGVKLEGKALDQRNASKAQDIGRKEKKTFSPEELKNHFSGMIDNFDVSYESAKRILIFMKDHKDQSSVFLTKEAAGKIDKILNNVLKDELFSEYETSNGKYKTTENELGELKGKHTELNKELKQAENKFKSDFPEEITKGFEEAVEQVGDTAGREAEALREQAGHIAEFAKEARSRIDGLKEKIKVLESQISEKEREFAEVEQERDTAYQNINIKAVENSKAADTDALQVLAECLKLFPNDVKKDFEGAINKANLCFARLSYEYLDPFQWLGHGSILIRGREHLGDNPNDQFKNLLAQMLKQPFMKHKGSKMHEMALGALQRELEALSNQKGNETHFPLNTQRLIVNVIKQELNSIPEGSRSDRYHNSITALKGLELKRPELFSKMGVAEGSSSVSEVNSNLKKKGIPSILANLLSFFTLAFFKKEENKE